MHVIQLEDEHSLFDYDVRQNDLIQIMVRKFVPPVISYCHDDSDNEKSNSSDKENVEVSFHSKHLFFLIVLMQATNSCHLCFTQPRENGAMHDPESPSAFADATYKVIQPATYKCTCLLCVIAQA